MQRSWFLNANLFSPALHVWAPAGFPLHVPVRADRQGLHQRCRLPRHHLTAAKHAGTAAAPPHRHLLPLQGKRCYTAEGASQRDQYPDDLSSSVSMTSLLTDVCVCSDFRLGDGEPASHQHGGAAHLPAVSGRPGASQGDQHTFPAAPADPDPRRDPHGSSSGFIRPVAHFGIMTV